MRSTSSSVVVVVVLALCLQAHAACAKDRTSPDDLRRKHAGSVTLTSDRSVSELYQRILDATKRCWSDAANAPSLVGGAAGELVRASRPVVGELSPDGAHAHVVVQVRAAFGLQYADILQVDINRIADATQLMMYYKNDVKMQRDYAVELEHWLRDDTSFCAPSMSKKKPD